MKTTHVKCKAFQPKAVHVQEAKFFLENSERKRTQRGAWAG